MSAVDWETALHREVVEKLSELMDDDDGSVETPSGYSFCGCLDCLVREALTMGYDRFTKVAPGAVT